MKKPRSLTLTFAALLLTTAVLLTLQLSWSRCFGTDAAGCGLTQGYTALGVYSIALIGGVLALLFATGLRVLQVGATAGLAAVAIVSTFALGATVQQNLRGVGTLSGTDPLRQTPTAEERVQQLIGCVLVFRRAALEHPDFARDFEDAATWFEGQVWVLSADLDEAELAALVDAKGTLLSDPNAARDWLATCSDWEIGRRDQARALREGAASIP